MRALIVATSLIVTACAPLPQGYYYRVKDGVRGDANAEVLGDFQRVKTICQGKAASAVMAEANHGLGTAQNTEIVFRGCMAENGYVVR